MMSCQQSAFLIFGLFVANSVITLTSGDALQQEYDICSSEPPNLRLEFPGDTAIVYVHVPQGAANTYSQSCVAEFETCDSCRFKVSAVQPEFEYPECRQASWSESYCPPDCVYLLLLDVDYKSHRRRVRNSLAADGFETESKSLQIVACRNQNSPGDPLKLRLTSVEKIQHITSNMFQPLSSRTFTSPNFPSPYMRNNEYYLYTFESSSRDKFITITFDDWMLSPYSAIKFDGANIVNRIHGDNHRPYIISSGMKMNMTFSTGERRRMSSDHNFIGFKGQARFYSKLNDIPHIESGCDRLLSTTEGGILHLNAAADGQNRDCIWIIKKLSGFDGVYVKILRYKTRYALMSSCDYGLEVREGLTSNSAQRLTLRPNDYIPNYAVQLSENGFYIRIKGCYFDDSVVLSYAMYLDDCDDYREYYKCDNGRCIADHLKCDTYDHCGDSSDEIPSMCGRIPSRIRPGVDYPSRNISNISAASYDYTLSIHIIIPLVVSIILGVGILCLLILLVRRCRRLSNSVAGSRPRNRRARGGGFFWRNNRDVQLSVTMNSGEHPPSYEDVIRSTPIGQLNMAFSWSACESLIAQPPSYDEAISPTSRTAQPSASINPHAAVTNSSSSGSGCHRETNSNQPQFYSRPFLVATLSASLYSPAADPSLSTVLSGGSSDGAFLVSPSENSQRETTLTSAVCVSDGSCISSNQNKNIELNSEISSERNIESNNTEVTNAGSRLCTKKKEEMSGHSASKRNNKHMNRTSTANMEDKNDNVNRTNVDTTRDAGDDMSNRNKRHRRQAIQVYADNFRTGSESNVAIQGATSNYYGVPILDGEGVRGRREAHSSRSQSCANISLDTEKSGLSAASGKRWQEDKRFSYAGMGDVSLIERGLDLSCNRRDQFLCILPEGHHHQSGLSTVSSDSKRNIYSRSRVCETDTTEDPAPKEDNPLSNQVTELSSTRKDKQRVHALASLDSVLEKSNECDVVTSLAGFARSDSETSRYTDNKVSDSRSQDILSRNKMYPVLSEQCSFETSSEGNEHTRIPDVAQKIPKQASKMSKDSSTVREVKSAQNVTGCKQNDIVHNPGGRQPACAKEQLQNKNMLPQTSNSCPSSAKKEDAEQILSHLQSQRRNPIDIVSEHGQMPSLRHEGVLPAADVTQKARVTRSKKPVPAPRIHGKNQPPSDI